MSEDNVNEEVMKPRTKICNITTKELDQSIKDQMQVPNDIGEMQYQRTQV